MTGGARHRPGPGAEGVGGDADPGAPVRRGDARGGGAVAGPRGPMAVGVALGMGAGALWALTFVAPALIAPSSPLQLTLLRYGVFGLGAVVGLALLRFNPFTRLSAADWGRVALLGFCGNVLYYVAAARAIQAIGPSAVALVLGTMPVAVAVVANLRHRSVPWGRLMPPLLVITAGLVVVGVSAPGVGDGADTGSRAVVVGFALAVVGLVAWLAYAVLNAEYLAGRPGTGALLWTCLTGFGTLLTLVPLAGAVAVVQPSALEPVAGGSVDGLIAWGLVLGVASSGIATWLWNGATGRVPASLLGYLIVSETLFAVVYDCIFSRRWPTGAEVVSSVLILGGVAWGLRNARGVGGPGPAAPGEGEPEPAVRLQ